MHEVYADSKHTAHGSYIVNLHTSHHDPTEVGQKIFCAMFHNSACLQETSIQLKKKTSKINPLFSTLLSNNFILQ
jgi:hypothetical protein